MRTRASSERLYDMPLPASVCDRMIARRWAG
jgi:hypothetical protein